MKLPRGIREKRKAVNDLKDGLKVIERAALDGAETVRRIQEFSRKRADNKNFEQLDVNELVNVRVNDAGRGDLQSAQGDVEDVLRLPFQGRQAMVQRMHGSLKRLYTRRRSC